MYYENYLYLPSTHAVKTLDSTQIKNIIKQTEETHAKNLEIEKRNLEKFQIASEIRQKVSDFMKTIPIAEKKSVRKKSRSIYPKWENVNSGWIDDLNHFYPIYGYKYDTKTYETNLKICNDQLAENERNLKEKREYHKQKSEYANKRFELIQLALKYKHSESPRTDSEEVLEDIIQSNKYLYLAHAMLEARLDFSNGENVGYALFDPETDLEKEIINNVSNAIDSYHECGDGRVFRDTNWSYDRIFDLVPEELLKDYNYVKNDLNGVSLYD